MSTAVKNALMLVLVTVAIVTVLFAVTTADTLPTFTR